MRALAAVLLLGVLGCSTKRPPPPPPNFTGPAFVDLEPGWRVQVITPILKSGGFLLQTSAEEVDEANRTITLRAGDGFLGYETASYAIGPRKGGGVRIAAAGVDLQRDGKLTHPQKSIAPRLRVPGRLPYIRLLFMQKASATDHSMAVLASRDRTRLQALTQAVKATPATACKNTRNEYCEWIPAGVAVRPERPDGGRWLPAR